MNLEITDTKPMKNSRGKFNFNSRGNTGQTISAGGRMSKNLIFKWREALRADIELEGTTKHVLAFLSFHMNENGGSCFPSQRTLATEAGLSRRSVHEHLKIAEKEGWVLRTERGLSGQEWKRHGYTANIPKKVGKEVHHVIEKGGEGGSPRFKEGGESNDIKVGKEVPLSTSSSTSVDPSMPQKKGKDSKPSQSGSSSPKRKSEAKTQESTAASEIFNIYLKEIAPKLKNKQAAIYNIEKHLKKYSKDDLTTAIMNYKPDGLGRGPEYRKAPANFFGTKKGNEYFVDYLPCNFKQANDVDKPVNKREWY